MTVPVAPRGAVGARAVVAAGDDQVVVCPDPGVDDGDVGIDPLVDAVDVGERRAEGADPCDAGRRRLGRDLDHLVGDHGGDARIGEERGALRLVELGREAAERVLEGAVRLQALTLAVAGHDLRRVGGAVEDHDVAARCDRSAVRVDGGLGVGVRRGLRRGRCDRLGGVRPARRTVPAVPRSVWARPWARADRRPGVGSGVGSGGADGSADGTTGSVEAVLVSAAATGPTRGSVSRAARAKAAGRRIDSPGDRGVSDALDRSPRPALARLHLRPLGKPRAAPHGPGHDPARVLTPPNRPLVTRRRGSPTRPRRRGRGCRNASCRARSRRPWWRSRSRSAAT